MDISKISAGSNPPEDINVVIEVPMSVPVKYELDKDSGAVFVDRFIATPMYYPCNYGFVPGTLSDDGDPADVLVVGDYPLAPGCVIRSRPVGVLIMEDEAGQDEKILAVPHSKMTPLYDHIKDINDLPEHLLNQVRHFFEHYKDLEKGKWVKLKDFAPAAEANRLIQEAVDRAAK